MSSYLGIEIGGTKLQLGIGTAKDRQLEALVRAEVEAKRGASGILAQIEQLGRGLLERHPIERIGVGFGGPVDVTTGRITKSHQLAGWEDVPLTERLEGWFSRPACVDNDCNVAALAEATLGAGRTVSRVFYVTVGTGIGGGYVVDGQLQGNRRPAIAEIGHLRPGTGAVSAQATVESVASGWGIADQVQVAMRQRDDSAAGELLALCDGQAASLTARQIAMAAEQGNEIAMAAYAQAIRVLGWAIAQMVTLLAPEMVVVGGGVSLVGDRFFTPLRQWAAEYVFPPLADTFSIVPAELGEEVVVHGALMLASASRASH